MLGGQFYTFDKITELRSDFEELATHMNGPNSALIFVGCFPADISMGMYNQQNGKYSPHVIPLTYLASIMNTQVMGSAGECRPNMLFKGPLGIVPDGSQYCNDVDSFRISTPWDSDTVVRTFNNGGDWLRARPDGLLTQINGNLEFSSDGTPFTADQELNHGGESVLQDCSNPSK
jgi:hypothetical protein